MFASRARLPADIPDGTSCTILFAEKYAACSYWALAKGEQVPWYVADQESGFQYRPAVCDPRRPQTAHHGGMPVGMGDGSIHFVSRSINAATWFAANTPAGKEELGAGLYTDW